MVSQPWLAACRDPTLFTDLRGLPTTMPITSIVSLLKQPRFSRVERLPLNRTVKLGQKGAANLAAAAPYLTHLDCLSDHKLHFQDDDLVSLFTAIPTLTSISHDMWNATSFGVAHLARTFKERLQHLHCETDSITEHYMSNYSFQSLGQSCPNLRSLMLTGTHACYYKSHLDKLTDVGVLAVLVGEGCTSDGCNKLEKLTLRSCQHLSLELFESIAERKAAGEIPNLTLLHVSDIPALTTGMEALEVMKRLDSLLSFDYYHGPTQDRVWKMPAAFSVGGHV